MFSLLWLYDVLYFCIMKSKVIESYRADKIKLSSLVRWSEFPDRLYFVREIPISFCGNPNCAKLETVDHEHISIVPISQLTLDDVDYDVVEVKLNIIEKSLRWIRNRMPKSKAAPIKELKERGLAFDAPKSTKDMVQVPAEIINNIISYCESEAIYDKLGKYGDFYYKLKQIQGE